MDMRTTCANARWGLPVLVIGLALFAGCDPAVKYAYFVHNDFDQAAHITVQGPATADSVSMWVPPDSTALVYAYDEIGVPRELDNQWFFQFVDSWSVEVAGRELPAESVSDRSRWLYSEDSEPSWYFGKVGDSNYLLELSPEPPSTERRLQHLLSWLPGAYSTHYMATPDKDLPEISLRAVPIWEERTDGPWLYLELAEDKARDEPFWQQVWRLAPHPDGAVAGEVFSIPSPGRFAGDWKEEDPFAALVPDQLTARPDCTVRFYWSQSGHYAGSTSGRDCPCQRKVARYETQEIFVRPNHIVIWNRGFDGSGTQVWGPAEGGFQFQKKLGKAR